MEATHFPIFIDISDMKILIAGGGQIAFRRVKTLLAFAKSITVVSPEICPEMKALVQSGSITWIEGNYSETLLSEAEMVLAATNSHEVNRKIAADCRKLEREEQRRILVNAADDKTLCDFYFPSIIRKEEIVIGLNSGGKNPGKVSRTRKQIEEILK